MSTLEPETSNPTAIVPSLRSGLRRLARSTTIDRGSAVILGGMLIQQSLTFVNGVVVAHAVGAAGYGTSNILRNLVAATLTLSPLGLDLALLKYGPRFTDPKTFNVQLSRLRVTVLALNVLIALVTCVALGGWLETAVYRIRGFNTLLLITAFGLPIASDLALMSAVYKVENKAARYALMSTWLQPPLRLCGSLAALSFGWGVETIVLTNTLAFSATAALVAVDRQIQRRNVTKEEKIACRNPGAIDVGGWPFYRTILRDSSWMALSLFAYGALRFVDILVLGAWSSAAQVGAYAALSAIAQLIAFYPLAMSQTLGPNISRRYHENDLAGVKRALNDYISRAALVGGFVFGGVAAFGNHPDLLFGSSFHFSTTLAIVLPLGWLVSATLAPTGYSLSMTGHHKAELSVLAAGGVIMVASCMLLIPAHGSLGAAASVLITFLAIDISRFVMVSRHLGFVPGHMKDFLPPAYALGMGIIIMAGVDVTLSRSLLSLVIGCGLYSLCFGALALYVFPRKRA